MAAPLLWHAVTMLIIQHIWTKWTKSARGANAPLKRPRLAPACEMPEMILEGARVLRHEIRATEREDFRLIESVEAVDRDGWVREEPHRNNALDWHDLGDSFAIFILRPSEYTQQTPWPLRTARSRWLTLNPGETARIEWNGRFRASLSGSNRSSYYEQHVYWLAAAERPRRRIFLDAEPKQEIDLTTHIY